MNYKSTAFTLAMAAGLWVTIQIGVISPASASDPKYVEEIQATLGNMTSQTESTIPANRTRTTVGIGENVTCTIDPATWVDCDFNTETGEGEDDEIGTRTWTLEGPQKDNCSLSATTGDSVILTCSLSPGNVTIKVSVRDSDLKHPDGAVVLTKTFTIVAPDTATYVKDADVPPWTIWTTGDKYLGARTKYTITLGPTTVSFYGASIRENFGAGETRTWPDGSTWYGHDGTVGPIPPDYSNQMIDTQGEGLHNSLKLYTGTVWQDLSLSFQIPLEYLNAASTWVPFRTVVGTADFYQADRKTVVGVAGVKGSPQGPFQAP